MAMELAGEVVDSWVNTVSRDSAGGVACVETGVLVYAVDGSFTAAVGEVSGGPAVPVDTGLLRDVVGS